MINETSSNPGTALLIADHDQEIQKIEKALVAAHYKVTVARSARSAFTTIFKSPPEIIILDINLPDLDGFHVAKELKRNMMLRHIPVIILSNRVDFLEKMRSLDVIVDEYLVRPFEIRDLLLRSQLVLSRAQSNLDANPLTRLPGNNAIVKAIKSRIGQGKPYAVGYADLNNFKAYNDKYGFSKGDEVITLSAKIIVAAVQQYSPQDNFVGHVGGDDFIFICGYDPANEICQSINETFDKEIPKFYNEEDLKKGYITVEDRRGIISQFPVVSVAVGMVSDEGNKFQNLGQINHSLTQLKKYAKSFQGSAYVRDRRTLPSQLAEFTWGPGSFAGTSKFLENITTALGGYMPGQLADIIKNKSINILFQPILDMKDDEVVAHESLVRGPVGTPFEFPDALFQTARTANQVPELDILCMKQMLASAKEFRRGMTIFVNIFPETLLKENLLQEHILSDERAKHLHLVFELSGSHRSNEPTELFATLRQLRDRGLKICIDASVALSGQGLEHLMVLKPDYIKLDMLHYRDMSSDPRKHDEFLRTAHLIRQVGSQAICTKLESRSDSFLALKAGVTLGQGFLFARPSQPSLATPVK